MEIISGGQTGVDRAALDVAIERGMAWGGWCPKGGWAEDFPDPPGLLAKYPHLKETAHSHPLQRTEWNDALANKSTMTRTYLRNHLDPIADRVTLIDGEAEVLPGIRVEPVPGHTWGQQAVLFTDDEGTVCFPGDVLPTINHAGLAFSIGYDMLPYQNMLTKRALLTRAMNERWRIALDHEPGSAVVSVQADPKREGQFVLKPRES